MEFRFNLNEFLRGDISKINKNLLPDSFNGDRRAAAKCIGYVSEIMDTMGLASAKAQALLKPITSAEKLRNSNYDVYLLADLESNNGKGTVVGLLKVGRKNLYMFDETGMTHERKALCILDFYVYESSQRKGYGKRLFEHMLHEENVLPHEMAIDKPSEKFLAFLFKHYGLQNIIPQSNNFVIYEGFFDYLKSDVANGTKGAASKQSGNDNYESEAQHSFMNHQDSIMPDEYGQSKYGRHAAYKPVSTIGQIVQSSANIEIPKNGS
ncbi:alpha-tubulin N-acetyltransferase isoform X2 [Nilaparvata lugens]|uniref:alpha-tubulin N-acetyltransferase isoform X2 n=1 Tax=Nilaparvata lugens TaxID=108931 RepID=UPI00193CC1DD|nr:alpha-tubulin N-acetyltransferase isoform X2 [Nilaparvata lugens]